MSSNLSPLKDNYGPCGHLIVACYLHLEYGVNLEEIKIDDCFECPYNSHQGKPFKPKSNELESRLK